MLERMNKHDGGGTKKGAEGRSLVPKKGSYSTVWNYFGFDKCDVNKLRVLCKLCSCAVKISKGNTTNLSNHLKSDHRVQYQECQKLKTQPAHLTPSHPRHRQQ